MENAPEELEMFKPVYRGKVRLIVWICFTAFLLIGTPSLFDKAVSSLLFGLFIGILPWTGIDSVRIVRGWSLFGWTVYSYERKLKAFLSIGTGSEDDDAIPDPTGMLGPILFGVWHFFWPLFGRLLPFVGGPYRLSMKDYKDQRMTVWQGVRESDFQDNLETLQERTNLPISRG